MNDTIVENVPPQSQRKRGSTSFNPYTLMTRELPYNNKKSIMSCNHWKKKKKQLDYLDHAITEQEIRQAVKKLKNKKSPFLDKIRNEKASLESLMPVYIKL